MKEKLQVLDKPYEKLEMHGAETLATVELLAILLRGGTKNISCLEIANTLLSMEESGLKGFALLDFLSIARLKKIPGIGKVKAVQIKAFLELAKRINSEEKEVYKILSPRDVYSFVKTGMEDKKQEIIKTIILNRKNVVQSIITNAIGGQSKIIITPKEILSEPIKHMASSIILVHNHPSGDPTPSSEDVNFTKNIIKLANMFDIEVLDHVVVGKNCFRSLKELELM